MITQQIEPPITDAEEELIGDIQAALYKFCEAYRGTKDEAKAVARHNALARLRRRLDDLEIERIMGMSDDEIIEHVKAEGGDPDEYVRRFELILASVKAAVHT